LTRLDATFNTLRMPAEKKKKEKETEIKSQEPKDPYGVNNAL